MALILAINIELIRIAQADGYAEAAGKLFAIFFYWKYQLLTAFFFKVAVVLGHDAADPVHSKVNYIHKSSKSSAGL